MRESQQMRFVTKQRMFRALATVQILHYCGFPKPDPAHEATLLARDISDTVRAIVTFSQTFQILKLKSNIVKYF